MTITCGKPPEKIETTLALKGAAEKFKLTVTYNNIGTVGLSRLFETKDKTFGAVLLELIDGWDIECPLSIEGLEGLEDYRPGILKALIEGYHQARQVELEKN